MRELQRSGSSSMTLRRSVSMLLISPKYYYKSDYPLIYVDTKVLRTAVDNEVFMFSYGANFRIVPAIGGPMMAAIGSKAKMMASSL